MKTVLRAGLAIGMAAALMFVASCAQLPTAPSTTDAPHATSVLTPGPSSHLPSLTPSGSPVVSVPGPRSTGVSEPSGLKPGAVATGTRPNPGYRIHFDNNAPWQIVVRTATKSFIVNPGTSVEVTELSSQYKATYLLYSVSGFVATRAVSPFLQVGGVRFDRVAPGIFTATNIP